MVTRIMAQEAAKTVAKKVTRTARKAAKVVQKNVADAVNGTLGITGERMSKVDTAWLRMDNAHNLMMIVGVWVLKPGITLKALSERIEERLLKYPRFGPSAKTQDQREVIESKSGSARNRL